MHKVRINEAAKVDGEEEGVAIAIKSCYIITNCCPFFLLSPFPDSANGQEARRSLNIMPQQHVQKYPVGKQMMLTCVPDVPDLSLITDLQWTDNQNYTVQHKP